jgi:hypothetical protein
MHADTIFDEVLRDASIGGQPFRAVPEMLHPEHVRDRETMFRELRRVLHCPEARIGKDMVLVWAVERPYTHSDGNRHSSTIVYIEKTVHSAYRRWPARYLKKLTTDYTSRPLSKPDDLRNLAEQNRNYSFYSRMVQNFGPLGIWQASAAELNDVSSQSLGSSREWETLLLRTYFRRHGCFPLKNRRA